MFKHQNLQKIWPNWSSLYRIKIRPSSRNQQYNIIYRPIHGYLLHFSSPISLRFESYRSYAQYREPRFLPLKKYLATKFFFFNSIQLAKLDGAYLCRFFGKKYFTSSDPFFVMYNDRCKSFIIKAVGDIK